MIKSKPLTSLMVLGLACLPAFAAAQEAQSSDIVVTGEKEPSRAAVNRQAEDIAEAIDIRYKPLARFEQPVCPGILGMDREIAEFMIDRIRFVAQEAGLRLSNDVDCSPNILIAFVPDPQAQFEHIRKESPFYLKGTPHSEVLELSRETGPVIAWTATVTKTRHGESVSASEGLFVPEVLYTPIAQSHIYTAHRKDIISSLVLIDVDAVDGLSAVQLADYAAMRSLAKTRTPKDEIATSTILSLFACEGEPPIEMSDFDRAYLASLYSEGGNLPGVAKTGGVAREMRKLRRDD
jgi:hypothetical protein